jgi:MOSC domain-containing protein YiiM
MAQIYSIVYQPKDRTYEEGRKEDFIRLHLKEAMLVANYGIVGDQKAGRHPDRQVNILSYEWLQQRQQEGYRAEPGQFGEQMIIEGLPASGVEDGSQLHLGSEAIVEITKARTGCDRLQAVQTRPITDISEGIGLMAKVVTGGMVGVGDEVKIVVPAETSIR